MIVIEGLLVLAMPFAVKYATGFAKNLGNLPVNEHRVAIIRGIVALLAVVGAILTQALGEGQLDPTLLETSIYTIFNGVFATWLYISEKNKK